MDVSSGKTVITYSYLIFFDSVGAKLNEYSLPSLATGSSFKTHKVFIWYLKESLSNDSEAFLCCSLCLAREWNHHRKLQASTIQLLTGEMTQSVMELGTQPEDVVSIPGTQMVEEN